MSLNRDESYDETEALLGSLSSLGSQGGDPDYQAIHPVARDSRRKLKWRYWKNVLVLSVSIQLVWISYTSLVNLEGSLNHAQGLGLVSMGTMSLTIAIGCIFAPIIVKRLGGKFSFILSYSCQLLFAGVNFYPRFWSLVPAAAIVGVTNALHWTAVGWYVVQAATGYSAVAGLDTDVVLTRFSGVVVGFSQSSQVVGNLISSLVLHKNDTAARQIPKRDLVYSDASDTQGTNVTCGAAYCDMDMRSTQSAALPGGMVSLLLGVYVLCCLAGLLLALFGVDRHPGGENLNQGSSVSDGTACRRVLATFRKHSDIRLALLIPLFFFNGLEQCFLFSEYTKAFVGCELGVGTIGFTMATFGALDCAGSLAVAVIGRFTGRAPLFALASLINSGLLVLMLTFDPSDWPRVVFYVVPGMWGLADAIWQTVTSAMLGSIFKDDLEPAWASFLLWQGGGMAFGFSTARFLCVSTQIYILLAILAAGFGLYGAMEVMIRRSRGTSVSETPSRTTN